MIQIGRAFSRADGEERSPDDEGRPATRPSPQGERAIPSGEEAQTLTGHGSDPWLTPRPTGTSSVLIQDRSRRAIFVRRSDVRFFAELRDVEARVLFGGADPERREDVDDPQDCVGPAEGKGRHDDARKGLDPQLPRVPEEQTVWP